MIDSYGHSCELSLADFPTRALLPTLALRSQPQRPSGNQPRYVGCSFYATQSRLEGDSNYRFGASPSYSTTAVFVSPTWLWWAVLTFSTPKAFLSLFSQGVLRVVQCGAVSYLLLIHAQVMATRLESGRAHVGLKLIYCLWLIYSTIDDYGLKTLALLACFLAIFPTRPSVNRWL